MIHDFPAAEIPDGASLSKAVGHYQGYEAEWKQSESWTDLKAVLNTKVRQQRLGIENCICFGLSSPTGLLHPTVDRRNVAMYQLVVFVSVIEALTEGQDGKRIDAYAQDPVFNDLDNEFLASLNIKVVDHPAAFHLVNTKTFAFCPGAEQSVLRGTLCRDPAMYMGFGDLDTYIDPKTSDIRSSVIGYTSMDTSDPATDKQPEIKKYPRADVVGAISELTEEPKPAIAPESADSHDDEETSPFVNWYPDAVRGATILHNFKKGKESYKLADFDAHDHALYDTRLFWRSSDVASCQQGEGEREAIP